MCWLTYSVVLCWKHHLTVMMSKKAYWDLMLRLLCTECLVQLVTVALISFNKWESLCVDISTSRRKKLEGKINGEGIMLYVYCITRGMLSLVIAVYLCLTSHSQGQPLLICCQQLLEEKGCQNLDSCCVFTSKQGKLLDSKNSCLIDPMQRQTFCMCRWQLFE